MKSRVTNGCASCPHYDGLADRCTYPRRGCVRDEAKPPPPPIDLPNRNYCADCVWFDSRNVSCDVSGRCVRRKGATPPPPPRHDPEAIHAIEAMLDERMNREIW